MPLRPFVTTPRGRGARGSARRLAALRRACAAAVPGARPARRLAVTALAGLAALSLAVPAVAQDPVWSATLTVTNSGDKWGFYRDGGLDPDLGGSNLGSLDDDDFEYGTPAVTYTVKSLFWSTGTARLFFVPDPALPAAGLNLVLQIEDERFPLGDARLTETRKYSWGGIAEDRLSTTPGAALTVSLGVPPNAPPAFEEDALVRTVLENSRADVPVGEPIPAATDANAGDTLTYSLAGTDAGSFGFDPATRQILTKAGIIYHIDTRPSYSVTVRVADDDGESDTVAVTVNVVANLAPAFDDDALVRAVTENSGPDVAVGEPIPAATDANPGDILTYSLEGTDAASFEFDPAARQISTKAGVTYDYDTSPTYSVTVKAEDTAGASDSVAVTVNVVANRPPAFAEHELRRTVLANSGPNVRVGVPIPAATDPDPGDTLVYSLEGTDAGSFEFDPATRQISTKAGVIYQFDTQRSYSVTVRVEDAEGDSDTVAVTIHVNVAPFFTDDRLERTVLANSPPGVPVGGPIPAATDRNPGDTLTYSMAGTDAGSFVFDRAARQILTKAGVTYDRARKPRYSVTVRVEDAVGLWDTVAVTIDVIDCPEPSGVAAGLSFDSATYAAAEGGFAATVRVNLSTALAEPVTVPLLARPAGGASVSDYTVPAAVEIGCGMTEATFELEPLPDTEAETNERVELAFGPLPPGVVADARGPAPGRPSGTPLETTVWLTDAEQAVWTASLTLGDGNRLDFLGYGARGAPGSLSVPAFNLAGVPYVVERLGFFRGEVGGDAQTAVELRVSGGGGLPERGLEGLVLEFAGEAFLLGRTSPDGFVNVRFFNREAAADLNSGIEDGRLRKGETVRVCLRPPDRSCAGEVVPAAPLWLAVLDALGLAGNRFGAAGVINQLLPRTFRLDGVRYTVDELSFATPAGERRRLQLSAPVAESERGSFAGLVLEVGGYGMPVAGVDADGEFDLGDDALPDELFSELKIGVLQLPVCLRRAGASCDLAATAVPSPLVLPDAWRATLGAVTATQDQMNALSRGYRRDLSAGWVSPDTFRWQGRDYRVDALEFNGTVTFSFSSVVDGRREVHQSLPSDGRLRLEVADEILPLDGQHLTGRGYWWQSAWTTANAPSLDNDSWKETIVIGTYPVRLVQTVPTLSALSLGDVELSPAFSPAITGYRVGVAPGESRVTVTAEATESTASVRIEPPDADRDTRGHQVDVEAGAATPIVVAVEIDDRALPYRIDVVREAPASPGQGATVWATAMTAGGVAGGFGYKAGVGEGRLLDDDFTLYGERYTVAALYADSAGLTLEASRNGAAAHAALNHLTLVAGGVALPLAAATSSATGLLWPAAWLDANAPQIARLLGKSGAVVRVKLRRISPLARLSGLSLAGIALTPVFEPGLRVYSTLRPVADDLESVTLRVGNAEAATVTVDPPDADAAAAGHQVPLGDGTTGIRVNLVSQDGTATGAYRVFVAKSAAVEVWRATLTSGVDVGNDEQGYTPTARAGTLVPDTFELGGRTEKVTALYGGDSEFQIWLEPTNDPGGGGIDDATLREMVFQVGNAALPGRNASRSEEEDVAVLAWSATWLTANAPSLGPANVETTLAEGVQLAVSLRVPPQPDPRLAALSLDGARLSPKFEPGVRNYTALAQEPVATVRAEPLDPSSSVSISPPDAMPDVAGHQVRLPAGEDVEIGVTVRQPRGSRTYTVSTAQAAGAWSSTMTVGFDIDDEDRDWVGYDRGHLEYDRHGELSGNREFTLVFSEEDWQPWDVIRLAVQSALRDDLTESDSRRSGVDLRLRSGTRGCRTTRLSLRIAGVTLPLASALSFQTFDDDITYVCEYEWRGVWLDENAPELLAGPSDRLLPVDAEVPVALVEESIARPFLRELSLSGASLFPPFRREQFDYEAAVVGAQVTVSAPPALSDARVTIEPPDADTDTGGHQVALTAGTETTITVTVRHLDEVRTYRVRVGQQPRVWNAVMVIGEQEAVDDAALLRGHQSGAFGSLAPDRFALKGVSYTVDRLRFGTGGNTTFALTTRPKPNAGFEGLVLEVGGHAIPVTGTHSTRIIFGTLPPALANTGDPPAFAATLPLGHAATVCLRSAGGSCPTGSIGERPASTTVSAAFGRAAYEAAEGGAAAPVEVRLGAPATADLEVPLIFTNLDGASNRDHGGGPLAAVRIPAGADSGTFALAAVDDAENDNGEAVEVTMGTLPLEYALGTPSSARVALVDNDLPTVSLRFGARGYLAVEGGAAATVTVTLDGAPDRALRIPLTVRRGAGVTDGDVGQFPVLVEFGAEETEKTFAVTALDDSDAEPDETLTLGFGTLPGGVTARSPASAVVLLGDDDDTAPVRVAFGSSWYSAPEGRDGAGNRIVAKVAVRLSRAPRKTVDVRLDVAEQGGAGPSDWDHDLNLGTLRFGALEREKTFTVWARNDSHDDDGESVRFSFDSVLAGFAAGAPTTVWLVDDDGDGVTASFEAGSYVSGAYLAAEGGDPPQVATVAVKVEPPPGRPLTLPLTFTHGAGATSLDYQVLPSGSAAAVAGAGVDSVTFDPDCANAKDRPKCEELYFDEWRDSVAVRAVDDVEAEGVETVTLGFGALPAGVATGEPATAVVRLEDDDEATPSVGFGASSYVAYENPAEGGAATVEVVLSRRLREDEGVVTVPIGFERRIATDADHGAVAAGVIFRPGEAGARATFEVAAIDDNDDDDGESLELSIAPTLPDGVRAGAMDTTRVWLVDDDYEPLHVSFEEATYRAVEGGSAVTVGVVLDLPLDDADAEGFISIPLTRTHLGGAEEADYGVAAAVRIDSPAEEPRGTVGFTAFSDDVDEGGEGVELGFGFLPPDIVPESPTTATVWLLESEDELRWTDVNAVRVGDRLEVAREAILDPDGVPDSGISYQWWRSPGGREAKWTEIDGATGSVYRPTVNDDAGMLLRPVVKFTDEGTPGTMETRTGFPVAVRPQGAIWGAVLRPGDFEYSDVSGRGYARVGDVRAGALTDTEFVYAGRDYTVEALGFGDDSAFFGFSDSVDGAFDTDLQMYLGPHTVVLQTPDGSRTLALNAPDELDTNHADADPEFVAGSVWPVFLVAVQRVSIRAVHNSFYAGLDNPVEFRLTRTVGAAVRDAMPVDEALEVALRIEQTERNLVPGRRHARRLRGLLGRRGVVHVRRGRKSGEQGLRIRHTSV